MHSKESQHSGDIPRREFLATAARYTSAGMAALPILSPVRLAANNNVGWTLRLSASSINFQHSPIEQACQRIAELGFEAVDIWSAHEGCPHLDDVLNRLGPEGLQSVLAEEKLKLFSFSVYRGGYPRYAKLLGDVGGGVAVRGSAGPCEPHQLTARMRDFLNGLRAEVELAEKYDSYLAIENHGNALLDSLDSLQAFVDLNQSPRLGIALAPYHLQALNASVEKAIEICGRQLRFFYAWQRADGTEQLPGLGPTDFSPWIAALEKARYGGYVNPFMHGDLEPEAMARALAKSRDYLKQCDQKRKVTAS
jgi:sugar phosphate isomerase/epimerase